VITSSGEREPRWSSPRRPLSVPRRWGSVPGDRARAGGGRDAVEILEAQRFWRERRHCAAAGRPHSRMLANLLAAEGGGVAEAAAKGEGSVGSEMVGARLRAVTPLFQAALRPALWRGDHGRAAAPPMKRVIQVERRTGGQDSRMSYHWRSETSPPSRYSEAWPAGCLRRFDGYWATRRETQEGARSPAPTGSDENPRGGKMSTLIPSEYK